MKKVTAVIPTYDEKDNIRRIIPAVLGVSPAIDILVVDDSSPDGTGEAVAEIAAKESRVRLLSRPGKEGLGRAYVAGFRRALSDGAEVVIQMDADFSHHPGYLMSMLQLASGADFVIGSRYCNGISVVNWPLRRLALSYGANLYASLVTGIGVTDLTSGFKVWNRRVLNAIDLESVESNGYSFQIEMTHRAVAKGFMPLEFPIIFVDRLLGSSKMSGSIVREAIFMVWKLRLKSIQGRLFGKASS